MAIADQARTIRIPVHMVETINKFVRTSRKLTQDFGKDPTPEEIAKSKELVNKQIDILADQFDDIEKQVMQLKSQDQSSVIGKAKSFIK